MLKNYTQIIYVYRLNEHCRYTCVSHETPYTSADILRVLGIDYLPDCVEFVRCHVDEGKSVCIYPAARMIKFKFNNLTIDELCTKYQNSWR